MGKTIHLVLALACAISFTATLSAQDVGKRETAKAAKNTKVKQSFVKYFGAAELTQAQQTQLKSLISAKKEDLNSIRKQLSELVSKEDAKTIKASVRKAMKEGQSKAEAQEAALSELSLSEEGQAKVALLQKQRVEIEKGIADQISATFSEEQKAAAKSRKGAAQGKQGKKKGADRKGKKAQEESAELTSVSVSLPGMT